MEVVEMGYRQQVDVHWLRGNSYLRIGWDWIRRTLIEPKELICDVRFVGHFGMVQKWPFSGNTRTTN